MYQGWKGKPGEEEGLGCTGSSSTSPQNNSSLTIFKGNSNLDMDVLAFKRQNQTHKWIFLFSVHGPFSNRNPSSRQVQTESSDLGIQLVLRSLVCVQALTYALLTRLEMTPMAAIVDVFHKFLLGWIFLRHDWMCCFKERQRLTFLTSIFPCSQETRGRHICSVNKRWNWVAHTENSEGKWTLVSHWEAHLLQENQAQSLNASHMDIKGLTAHRPQPSYTGAPAACQGMLPSYWHNSVKYTMLCLLPQINLNPTQVVKVQS
jgi:hypothetical protein